MRRRAALVAAIGLVAFGGGASAGPPAASQALRTCVDRWNQDTMVDWGPMSVRVAIRGLSPRERSVLSYAHPLRHRCIVSLARRPGDDTWICILTSTGAYDCPLITSDGMPPLRTANGSTDAHGVLELDVALARTHPTPPLAWQRRYRHVDGYVVTPWTPAGEIRAGLKLRQFASAGRSRGTCVLEYEHVVPKGALRCISDVLWAPCFPSRRDWNRPGTVLACGSPGSTTFARFVITRRS
jgi:hypothetical protein